jgi:hypothetical protein
MDQKMTKCQAVPQRTRNELKAKTTDNYFWVVAYQEIPNPPFFVASLNLEDEILFKGGSLSHPKKIPNFGMWK